MMEKIVTETSLFDKPGNILNVDEIGIQECNKSDSVITVNGSKLIHVVTCGEKGENVTVIACCTAVCQVLSPVLIFKGFNMKT
jgi:hypothetical protein